MTATIDRRTEQRPVPPARTPRRRTLAAVIVVVLLAGVAVGWARLDGSTSAVRSTAPADDATAATSPNGTVKVTVDGEAPFRVEVGPLRPATAEDQSGLYPGRLVHELRYTLNSGSASLVSFYPPDFGRRAGTPEPRLVVTTGGSGPDPNDAHTAVLVTGQMTPSTPTFTNQVRVDRNRPGLAPFTPGHYEITFVVNYFNGDFPDQTQPPDVGVLHLTIRLAYDIPA